MAHAHQQTKPVNWSSFGKLMPNNEAATSQLEQDVGRDTGPPGR